MALGVDAVRGQQHARAAWFSRDQLLLVDRALEAAAQRALDALVELLEQRGLPGVPQLRVGAAHVGAGQHVEVVEVRLVAHVRARSRDHLRVVDVLLLRGDRQHQVVAHQPGDQARVVARQALLEAEGLGVHGAQLGVVAAAALGDVVEQRRRGSTISGFGSCCMMLRQRRQLVVVAAASRGGAGC